MKLKKQMSAFTLILTIFLFFGVIISIFPFVWMILSSFKNNAEIIAFPPTFFPKKFEFSNYSIVFNKFHFLRYFGNSLYISVIKTVIIIYTSALFGYVFNKISFPFREKIFAVVLSTMMIPWVVTIIPMYDIMVRFGWVGSYKAIIITGCISSFGIFMMKQFVSSIPDELIESARMDGAGEFKIFHKIIFPLLGNAISALGIFTFLGAWDDLLWPYLMISDDSKYTIPIGLTLFSGQHWTDYSLVLAGATVSVVPILVVYVILQKRITQGIAMTGLKA